MHQPYQLPALAVAALCVASPHAGAAFIDDSQASLTLRNFYLNQDIRNEDAPSLREWGQGFFINYQSGHTEGPLGIGLDALAMWGVRLDSGGRSGKAGIERQPGSVFPLERDGEPVDEFGRLGLTAKLRLSKTEARLGTLLPKLPVLGYGDSRLLPQTFQGSQVTSSEWTPLSLTAGKLERAAERNSSNTEGMSIPGANSGATRQQSNAFWFGGADYRVSKNLLAQYYYGNLEDFYRQHFLGLAHQWALPMGTLKTDLRYFHSDSDGKNASTAGRAAGYLSSGYFGVNGSGQAITRGEVDNRLWSALLSYGLAGHSLSAGYQQVTGDSDFPQINQGAGRTLYLITNAQLGKFASAGEQTWMAGYAYDFSKVGLPGLKAGVTYYSGRDIDAPGADNEEWERNLRVDYVVPQGTLEGLGITWRNAVWRGNDAKDTDEHSLIVSYTLPLL